MPIREPKVGDKMLFWRNGMKTTDDALTATVTRVRGDGLVEAEIRDAAGDLIPDPPAAIKVAQSGEKQPLLALSGSVVIFDHLTWPQA